MAKSKVNRIQHLKINSIIGNEKSERTSKLKYHVIVACTLTNHETLYHFTISNIISDTICEMDKDKIDFIHKR